MVNTNSQEATKLKGLKVFFKVEKKITRTKAYTSVIPNKNQMQNFGQGNWEKMGVLFIGLFF